MTPKRNAFRDKQHKTGKSVCINHAPVLDIDVDLRLLVERSTLTTVTQIVTQSDTVVIQLEDHVGKIHSILYLNHRISLSD